nr:hypothetical protein [Tanacetum cinerariifolium]
MMEQMQKLFQHEQEKLKKMREQLKQLEDNAKSSNPNKILNSIAICSVTVLLFFYCLIIGLASLKHKQNFQTDIRGSLLLRFWLLLE